MPARRKLQKLPRIIFAGLLGVALALHADGAASGIKVE